MTCSTSAAPDAQADVAPPPVPFILDEIDRNMPIGTAGSSLIAVQEEVKMLEWGADISRIGEAATPIEAILRAAALHA